MKSKSVVALVLGAFAFTGVVHAQTFGTPPLEVTGLAGTAGSGFIDLTWDEGVDSDDGVIVGYNIYYGQTSVQEQGTVYDETLTVSSRTTHTLEGLTGTGDYYIAVTALDDDGNESETYSREIKVSMGGGTSEVVAVEAPRLLSARQTNETEIEVIFSEAVKTEDNKEAFLVESLKTGRKVTLESVVVDSDIVTITVAAGALEGDVRYSVTPTAAVRNRKGISVEPGGANTVSFTALTYTEYYGPEEAPVEEPIQETAPVIEEPIVVEEEPEAAVFAQTGDFIAPSEATELKVSTADVETTGMVTFTWIPSADTEGDLVEQVLYFRESGASWEPGIILSADINRAEIEAEANKTYDVKVTSVDTSANESSGANLTFSTPSIVLAESGPGINLFAILAIIAGGFMLRSVLRQE